MVSRSMALRLAAAVAVVIAIGNIVGCGVLDAIFGGHTNTNGARGVISQERNDYNRGHFGYWLGGTQNDFRAVDIVPLLTGDEVCGSVDNDLGKGESKASECIEWAFNCFHHYEPGKCPLPEWVAANPAPTVYQVTAAATATPTPNPDDHGNLDLDKSDSQQARRNYIQERLIAASNSSCSTFEQNLNGLQSWTNFGLGTASLGAGAAGAIVSSAVAAKALAGTAGALSGTKAEFNNDIFLQQLVPSITLAIDTARSKYLLTLRGSKVEQANLVTEATSTATTSAHKTPTATPTQTETPTPFPTPKAMNTPTATPTPATSQVTTSSTIPGKQSLSPAEYTVEAAVADAITYNDLCSLNKGLQQVSLSLSQTNDVGMKQFLTELQTFNQIQALMNPSKSTSASPSASTSPTATPIKKPKPTPVPKPTAVPAAKPT